MRLLHAIAVLPALVTPLAAQQATYRWSPKDTARYHEITEATMVLQLPARVVTINTRHDAVIALMREAGDTLTAWYEVLTLSRTGPQGESQTPTNGALHLPFRLAVTRSGRVTTVAAPTFPAEVATHADLTREFEDFFISLPTAALKPQAAWADTVLSSKAASPAETYESRHIRRYRVVRDTVIAGGAAVVIALEQDVTLRSSGPIQNGVATVATHLEGSETGTAVFSPATGRFIARMRKGHLAGEQVFTGMGREITAPLTYDYTSSLARSDSPH